MPPNCIRILSHCLISKYLLGKNNLRCPRQRTSQLRHWSQEHPFCSPGLQSWNSRILWVTLHRVQTSGKHTRKETARIQPTSLMLGSVALELYGIRELWYNIKDLMPFPGWFIKCRIGVCQWLKGWSKYKTISKAQCTSQQKILFSLEMSALWKTAALKIQALEA